MVAKAAMISRYLLGIIFTVFGANGAMMFITGSGFIPMPPPNDQMQAVMAGFAAAGYLMPLVKILEIAAGVMLLANVYVPLACVFLAPIAVNILGVHLFVDMSGLPVALLICVMLDLVIWDHWDSFKALVQK